MEDNNNKRKIFLDNLPRWVKGTNKGKINWKESIGRKVKFIYNNINGEIKIVDYINSYLYIQYENKPPFKILTGNFSKCKIGVYIEEYTNNFKIKIGSVLTNEKRDLVIIDRKYKKVKRKTGILKEKWYKYKCNKCGFMSWITEGHLMGDRGCACCGNNIVAEGINDIPTTTPWMIKYFQGGYDEAKLYTCQSNKKIFFKCPDCKRIRKKSINISNLYQTHSIGCPCSDGQSYPNKLMFNILYQLLNNNFESEYCPDWISPKRFDFYFQLNSKKYIVEMDGSLGHGNGVHGKSNRDIEYFKNIDDNKDKMATKYNVEVIRIDCRKSDLNYIKNNDKGLLNSKLAKIFNLNKIDWIQAEEYALSNLCKQICELKRDNPNYTTTNIVKIMKLDRCTIISYLKKGTRIWDWINYDPKEETRKSCAKNGVQSGKTVEVFKDGVSFGIFPSCAELSRESEKIFGIKLCSSSISLVCIGKQKKHKGFTFEYIIAKDM